MKPVAAIRVKLAVGEVKGLRGKKLALTAASVHGLRNEYTRTTQPSLARADETLTLERKAEG